MESVDLGPIEVAAIASFARRIAVAVGGIKDKQTLDQLELGPQFTTELRGCGANIVEIPIEANPSRTPKTDVALVYLGSKDIATWRSIIVEVMGNLRPGGKAIFELPVAGSLFEKRTVPIASPLDLRMAPSLAFVREKLFSEWATRDLGAGLSLRNQKTTIFSCTIKAPSAILIGGASGAGKTTLAASLASCGCTVLHFDFILSELIYLEQTTNNEGLKFAKLIDRGKIGTSIDALIKDGHAADIATQIVEYFNPLEAVSVGEGYIFRSGELRDIIITLLKKRGFRVFSLDPSH
jgi:hypothetical protein